MIRSQKILLHQTNDQASSLICSAGLSRFAWNWAVALCRRHYEWYGDIPGYKRLTAFSLSKRWNRVKDRHFPWVRDYSKLIPEESFRNVEQAYQSAFRRLKNKQAAGFPRFHRKGVNDGFQVVPSKHYPMRRVGKRFNFPRIGFVKCQTKLRWPDTTQVYGRVKLKAGRWWLTLSYDLPDAVKLPDGRPTCGIDLGCTTFATVASGGVVVDEVAPPKPYAKAKRRLNRLQRVVSRRKKGSANRKKAVRRLAKAYERTANIRGNFLHQFTSHLTKRFGVVVLEDLNVKGLSGGMLAGTIQDLGFGEFRRQVEYKSEATGTKVLFADRFYPSSKTCSSCGLVKTKLSLSERVFNCECGLSIDRDVNAAMNLEKLGYGIPEVKPVESGVACSRKRAQVPLDESGIHHLHKKSKSVKPGVPMPTVAADQHKSKKLIRLTLEQHEFLSGLAERKNTKMSWLLSRALCYLSFEDSLGLEVDDLDAFLTRCHDRRANPKLEFSKMFDQASE